MDHQPAWTACPHLQAGTCLPALWAGRALSSQESPRPELNQDLALARLGRACAECALGPRPGPQSC